VISRGAFEAQGAAVRVIRGTALVCHRTVTLGGRHVLATSGQAPEANERRPTPLDRRRSRT